MITEVIRMATAKHFLRNPKIRSRLASLKVLITQINKNRDVFYGHSSFPLGTNKLFLQLVYRTAASERTVRKWSPGNSE